MSTIIDMLRSIGEFFGMVIDFVVKLFKDLVYIVKLLGSVVQSLPSLLGFLPLAVTGILTVTFAVVVIYKVLGREG